MTVTNWSTYFGGGITVQDNALNSIEEHAKNLLTSSSIELHAQTFCSVVDLVGLEGSRDGQCIFVASYYDSKSYLPGQSGGGYFVWKADALRSTHNGVTIFSPTVPWDGTQATLTAFHAKTGETSPSGTGCWVRQHDGVINVLMAGAVGGGSVDDRRAFLSSIAIGLPVYAPTGTYKLTDRISLGVGQKLYGDGHVKTVLYVDTDFNMSAYAVVDLGKYANFQAKVGGELYDLKIEFYQDTAATTRAELIQYPVAIYGYYATHIQMDRVRIVKAYNGVSLTGNCSGFKIGVIEICAFNKGMVVDGPLDFCHMESFHSWPFEITPYTLYTSVWGDGTTIALEVGMCETFVADKISAFRSAVNFLTTAASWPTKQIGILQLDGKGARMTSNATYLTIGQCYGNKSDSSGSSIVVESGITEISNYMAIDSGTNDNVKCTGGKLLINGGYSNVPSGRGFLADGGTLKLSSIFCELSATARTNGYIEQVSGVLIVNGCDSSTAGSVSSSPLVKIATDNAAHRIQNNFFSNWGFSLPAGAYLGCYGPNRIAAIDYTPAVSFATNGDFVPTYTFNAGKMWYETGGVRFEQRTLFTVNAYTTASGNFQMSGPPVTQYAGLNLSGVSLTAFSNVDLPAGYTQLGVTKSDTADNFNLRASGDNVAYTLMTVTHIPAGKANVEIVMSGFIPTL